MDTDPILLRPEDAAARALELSRTTTYALIASGQLRSVKIGRARRVPRSALTDFVDGLPGRESSP